MTGSPVPFKILREKDKALICPRHLLYHLGTDLAYDFTLLYTGEVWGKYVLETLLFVAHGAEYIFVQNVRYEVSLHPPRIDYFFIVFAYILEHVFDAVGDFIGVIDSRKVAPAEALVTNGAFGTSFIGSVNAEATKASDGPTGVIDSITSSVMPGEGVWASSFNTDLIEEVGDIIAEDARINDFDTMYAPGVNLHRTPFGGRANEYFSEDPYLTAMSAVAEIKGMQAKGVISVIKHFAFNEAESARNGISVWLNEQAARELYLMPFEYAMRPSIGATYGAMSSFNRAGTIWTGASRALQMDIARDEWDYQGYFITDMADGNGALYMVYTDGIYNGTDLFLGNGSKSALAKWRNNAAFRMRVREAAHRVLYVNTNFNSCMNGIASDTKIVEIIPWWQATLIALISVVAAGTAASLALWGVAFFKKKTKHAEHS